MQPAIMSLMAIPVIWYPEYLRESAEKLHSLEKRLRLHENMRRSMPEDKARAGDMDIRNKFFEIVEDCEFGRISSDSPLRHLVSWADGELTPELLRIVSDLFADMARGLEYAHAAAAHAVSRRVNMLDS